MVFDQKWVILVKNRVFKNFKSHFSCVNCVIHRLSTLKIHPIMGPKNGQKMAKKWPKTPKMGDFWVIFGHFWVILGSYF